MERLAAILRDIAERAGLPPLVKLARQPGVKTIYRVTVHYDRQRACNSAATLCCWKGRNPVLEVIYQGRFHHKPITHPITEAHCEAFGSVLQKVNFDHLPDQPQLVLYGIDLWLVERAAGGFNKSVILSPNRPDVPYSSIVNAVDAYLPEAVREIP